MKKGLMAGGILLGCVLLLSGIAAADVSTSGLVEFQIGGDPAGLHSGTVESTLSYTISVAGDSWEGGLTAKFEDEEATLALNDAYIQYTGHMASIKMSPLGVSYPIYDLGGDIAENPGFTLTANLAPLTITTVLNNVDSETNGVDWDYGVGGEYAGDVVTLGVRYNDTKAYGAKLVGTMAPITLTGQYGNDGADRTGYLAKAEYAFAAGSVSVAYQKSLDDRTTVDEVDDAIVWEDHVPVGWEGADAVTGDPFTRITATLADIPITDTTTFKLEVVNQDLMDVDYAEGTTYVVETATTLIENVTLTINVESAGETLSYYGKIGVAL
jgi:hypothetical protein